MSERLFLFIIINSFSWLNTIDSDYSPAYNL